MCSTKVVLPITCPSLLTTGDTGNQTHRCLHPGTHIPAREDRRRASRPMQEMPPDGDDGRRDRESVGEGTLGDDL